MDIKAVERSSEGVSIFCYEDGTHMKKTIKPAAAKTQVALAANAASTAPAPAHSPAPTKTLKPGTGASPKVAPKKVVVPAVPPGMVVVMEHITSLKRYPNNPRRNAQAVPAVMKSLAEFGWRQPLVVDKEKFIVVGDTRFQASERLSQSDATWEWVPTVYASDLTPAQINAYRLADNRVGEISEWDDTKLMQELGLIMEEGFDLEGMGFTEEELDLNAKSITKKEDVRYLEDFDVMPTPKPKWILISAPEDDCAQIIGTINAMGLHNMKLEYSGDPNQHSAKHPGTQVSAASVSH